MVVWIATIFIDTTTVRVIQNGQSKEGMWEVLHQQSHQNLILVHFLVRFLVRFLVLPHCFPSKEKLKVLDGGEQPWNNM